MNADKRRCKVQRRQQVQRHKTWTLTDIHHDLWLDTFSTGSDRLAPGFPSPLGGEGLGVRGWSIRKRTLHGGLRDGIDLVEVDNGALSFTILPTRGMSLWQGRYKN